MIIAWLLFVAGALLAALSGLISDEVRGWLELAPRGILRLVAMRIPVGQRKAIYDEEWLPELLFILRKAEGRPITRLSVGIWFAVSMIRSAGRVARTLADVRKEPEPVISGRWIPSFDSAAGSVEAHDELVTREEIGATGVLRRGGIGFSGQVVVNANTAGPPPVLSIRHLRNLMGWEKSHAA